MEQEKDIEQEIEKENLKDYYKFVYTCDNCSKRYGSDKEEKEKHLCPICDGSFKR
jgi:rRNA maturation endonuclease Nob1